MNLMTALTAISLLLVAPRLDGSAPAVGEQVSVQISGNMIHGTSAPVEATSGSGHLLREATVTPSAKFVTVRWRERPACRDGLALSSVNLASHLVERPHSVPGLRSFILRI